MALPHEILATEVAADASTSLKLQEAIGDSTLPPAYWEHPVVRAPGKPVVPFALDMDAVQYSNADTAIGIWLISLLTNDRFILTVLRKRILCQCGCRGRDTLHPILVCLRWSLQACANASYPNRRHDGCAFLDTEHH